MEAAVNKRQFLINRHLRRVYTTNIFGTARLIFCPRAKKIGTRKCVYTVFFFLGLRALKIYEAPNKLFGTLKGSDLVCL